jgi:hypothetical protein
MSRLRRLGSPRAVSIVALVVAISSPAWGGPVADAAGGAARKIKKALNLSRGADQRSQVALDTANRASAAAAAALAKGGPPAAFNLCATATAFTTPNGAGLNQETSPAFTCSLSITVPASGFLLITASGQGQQTSPNCPGIDDTHQNQIAQAIAIDGSTIKSSREDLGDTHGSHEGAISVGAQVGAGPHTVTYSMIVRYGGTCTNGVAVNYRFFQPSVEAVFSQH